MDDSTKQDLKRFVDRWRVAGPALEAHRLQELSRLNDEQARCATLDLFNLWRPAAYDEFGAELVEQQRVFRLWQKRPAGTPMTALVAAAREILDWLRHDGWRSCVIGGLAVQRWGEPRLTQDVDLTVLVGPGTEAVFVDAALARFPGRRPDARPFALTYRVLLVQADNGVAIDLALGSTVFEIECG